MEIKELRFGNLVFLENPESWKQLQNIPMKVVGIGRNPTPLDGINETITVEKLYHNKYDIYKDYSQFAQYIKPILLSKKWLLFFGFKKEKEKYYLTETSFNVRKTQYNYFSLKLGLNTYICEIKYVHQLQNLYFDLTKKELTKINNESNK